VSSLPPRYANGSTVDLGVSVHRIGEVLLVVAVRVSPVAYVVLIEPKAQIVEPNRLHGAPTIQKGIRIVVALRKIVVERHRRADSQSRKTARHAVSATLQSKGLIDFEEYGPPHFFSAKSVLISFRACSKKFHRFRVYRVPYEGVGIACNWCD